MAGVDLRWSLPVGAGRGVCAGNRRGRSQPRCRASISDWPGRKSRADSANAPGGRTWNMRTRPARSTRASRSSAAPTGTRFFSTATSTGTVPLGHAIDGDSQQLAVGCDAGESRRRQLGVGRCRTPTSTGRARTRSIPSRSTPVAFAPQTCTIGGNSRAATCGSASATRSGKTT